MSRWTVSQVMMVSFLIGLLLSLFPLPLYIRQWWPEWLLVIVIFWAINKPHAFSVGKAFMLGLIVDAMTGNILTMHAIPYACVVYLTRLWGQNFPLWTWVAQLLFISLLIFIATLSHVFLLLFSPLMLSPFMVYLQIGMASIVAWLVIHIGLVRWHRQL